MMRKWLNNVFKRPTLLSIAATSIFTVSSDNLVIRTSDGQKISIDLIDSPVMKFLGNELIVTTADKKWNFNMAVVDSVYYNQPQSNIITDKRDNSKIISFTGRTLTVDYRSADATIRIYTVEGKSILTVPTKADDKTLVFLDKFDAGIYIVSVGNVSEKIILK